jgi:site-specific DNA-methyltransferase (adenine-specific)
MKDIPDGSIELVLTDPPYNTTACEWDQQPIDLPELWKHLKRVLKPKGAVVMTGSQPFTTDLIMSNRKWFKHSWVWDKERGVGFQIAKFRPMMRHEDVLIFGNSSITYNPQMVRKREPKKSKAYTKSEVCPIANFNTKFVSIRADSYPTSIIKFSNASQVGKAHPTQKPVALFEYLIRTYSNENETVLDPFCGSGTTALAAHATGRNFICMEKEPKYHAIANKRLALAQMQGRFEEMVG